MNIVSFLKKYLRRNRLAIKTYYYGKRIILYPLRYTALAPIADTTFPLRGLFNLKKAKLFAIVRPYTLLSYRTLDNAYTLATSVEKRKIAGAFVECGTWKGGGAAVMASVTNAFRSGRTTWYFDSFEGMPPPTKEDSRGKGKKGEVKDILGDTLKVSVSDVEEVVFKKLKLPKEKNRIIKGWFAETLPKYKKEIGPIAILRLDGDWYESTKVPLETLFDQVSMGGYIIIDDYGAWEGCRRAVHEFRDTYGIIMDLKFIGTRDTVAYKMDPPAYFKKVNEQKK
jgi:hypothetical protein